MIIVGYPGIGKSAISNPKKGIIDLDSYFFHKDDDPWNSWASHYCDTAIDLHKQGFTVLISSHEWVRVCLQNKRDEVNEKVALVFPELGREMEHKWVERLANRYYESRKNVSVPHWMVEKNYKALEHVKTHYSSDIRKMKHSPFFKYVITELPYNLDDMLTRCKNFLEGVEKNETGETCEQLEKNWRIV